MKSSNIQSNKFMTYENHRDEPYFSFLKNGQKTIEGRIRKKWYRILKPGDHIIVHNKDNEADIFETVVKDVRNYSSIKEMLEKEQFKKILPDIETVEQGIEVYRKFYTEEQEKEFGVVAIEVEPFLKP